jgi:hypothetical protein
MDLAIEYCGEWNIIEIKLVRKGQSFDAVKAQGVDQILRYHDAFRPSRGDAEGPVKGCYLVIFDRRPEARERAWSEKLSWDTRNGVTVVGC